MKILNFGSINIDYIYELEHFVQPGETVSSTRFVENYGGKGLNQSIAMAKAGLNVYHAGAVGEKNGERLVEFLKKNNVNTDNIKYCSGPTGHAIIQVTSAGENCIVVYSGSNSEIDKPFIDNVFSGFTSEDICVLQNEISNVSYIIEQAHSKGMRIIFNPSPFHKDILNYPLDKIDYIILNEIEGTQLTNGSGQDEVAEKLCLCYPNSNIILTLGNKGVIYKNKNGCFAQNAFSVPVVDTTAAGDTFTGYFIYGIAHELSVQETLLLSSAAASLTISKKGAAVSIPKHADVAAFLNAAMPKVRI